jgi:hypothetical protein
MQSSRVHPVLLVGLLSLAAATVLSRLTSPTSSTDFLQGFLNGSGLACVLGYLLALRRGRLGRSK